MTVSLMAAVAVAASAAAAQSPVKTAPATPAIHACALLTRDLAAKFDTQNPKVRALFKPTEEAIGTHGSSCTDGGILLQVDPFVRDAELRKSPGKEWQPLAGVGDTAFFRDNGGRWAELIVWSGRHHFTLQIDVPNGATAESVKPKAVGLATALIARLQ